MANHCVLCGGTSHTPMLEVSDVPTRHVRPMGQLEHESDLGDICIGVCDTCGHVSNRAFGAASAENLYEVHPSTNAPVHESMLRGLRNIATNILGAPPTPKRILEIGCGVGALARLLVHDAACVHLIEPNLSVGESGFGDERISFLPGFFPAASTGETYDLVICRQVLEHIENPVPFLQAIREHIAPAGRAYIEVPSMDYINAHASISDFHYLHVQYFSDAIIRTLLARTGFEVIGHDVIKDGHDAGYHVIPAESREVPWPNNDMSDLPRRLAVRRENGRRRLASMEGDVALYGACAYAQALLGLYPELCHGPLMFDDTEAYSGLEAYSSRHRLPIARPNIQNIADVKQVIITSWLHDAAIVGRLKALGYNEKIVSLRCDSLAGHGNVPDSLFANASPLT